jgi:cytochrome P450
MNLVTTYSVLSSQDACNQNTEMSQTPEQASQSRERIRLISAKHFNGDSVLPPGQTGFFATLRDTALLWLKGGELASYAIQRLPAHVSRDIAVINTLFRTVIVITNPDYMRPFLALPRSGSELLSEGRPWQLVANEFGDHNLLTCFPTMHAQLREFLKPYFSFEATKERYPAFLKQSVDYLERWIQQNQPINISIEIADFAADNVIKILFQRTREAKHAQAVDYLTRMMGYKMLHIPEFFLNQKKIKQYRQEIDQLVDDLIEVEERSNTHLNDLIENLSRWVREENLSWQYVRESLKLLLFAGLETSSSLLTSCLYSLAKQPDLQETLLAEMEEKGIQNIEDLKADHLSQLTGLRNFINKVLREHPPIWGQTRRVEEESVLDGSSIHPAYRIPHQAAIILLHAPVDVDKESKKCPLNFGTGVNECIGQFFVRWEVRTFLASLLLKAKIRENHREPKWDWLSTHHIQGDFFIELESR